MLAIYTIIFTGVFSPRFGGGNIAQSLFPLYLGSGFLPWGALAECITRGANAFIANSAYLKKMRIPEQVFVAQAAVSATFAMFISVGLLIGLSLILENIPHRRGY